nr:alcohol dehydrogenase catalytic domain-containing protein [Gammaproteobacteria bacterium]
MNSNKALFIHGAGDIRICDYSPPEPTDSEVMVKVKAVGLCGSDLHYYKDGGIGAAKIRSAFIPGHEFSAVVTRDVPEKNIEQGELAAVDPATPCHNCEWCRRGYHNLCPNVKFIGA